MLRCQGCGATALTGRDVEVQQSRAAAGRPTRDCLSAAARPAGSLPDGRPEAGSGAHQVAVLQAQVPQRGALGRQVPELRARRLLPARQLPRRAPARSLPCLAASRVRACLQHWLPLPLYPLVCWEACWLTRAWLRESVMSSIGTLSAALMCLRSAATVASSGTCMRSRPSLRARKRSQCAEDYMQSSSPLNTACNAPRSQPYEHRCCRQVDTALRLRPAAPC